MTRPQRGRAFQRGRASFSRTPFPAPAVNGYSIRLVSPNNGFTSRDPRPDITFVATSILGDAVDVQVEWRTTRPLLNSYNQNWSPVPTYTQLLTGLGSGTQQVFEPPTDLSTTTWYYRLRAGRSSTPVWGEWTATNQFVDVQKILGSVSSYLTLNVGVVRPSTLGAVAYTDMNVGVPRPTQLPAAFVVTDMNVGLRARWKLTSLYSDMNVHPVLEALATATYADMNVTTTAPAPEIWWVRPEQGREGYVFNIFGHGFGDFENEYDGEVVLGDMVCQIAEWKRVPPTPMATTVTATGTPRSTTTVSALPNVRLNDSTLVFAVGDTIEYDMRWDAPVGQRLDIHPHFMVGTTAMGIAPNLLTDTLGRNWIEDIPEAYGAWAHRKFTIPAGNQLVGKTASSFAMAWYGTMGVPVPRTGAVRSFVIRNSDGTAKLWVTGDDNTSKPSLVYTSNTGVLTSASLQRDSYQIVHGVGLAPDSITTEHGWIVAVVPTGAVSGMIEVILRGV